MGLFRDAGWKLVRAFSGWHYFRRPYEQNKPMRIYTDKEEQIRKYNKVLIFLLISGLPSIYFSLIWPQLYAYAREFFESPVLLVLRVLVGTVACVVAFSAVRVFMMVRHLRCQTRRGAE